MNTKDMILSKISDFPTLPMMATRLLKMLDNQEVGFSQIAEVIRFDPALTANVLKAANSSFLGFHRQVSSITEAAIRLGTNWIFKIAISSLINSAMKKPAAGYELSAEELWTHSIMTAMISDNLCKTLMIKDDGQIYTAALLHDMGKIVLGDFISEPFASIMKVAEERNIPFEEVEKMEANIDHAEIGGLIAEKWNFPPLIVACIRYHHNPDGAMTPSHAIDVVHIADALCTMADIGAGRDGLRHHPHEGSIKRLGLTGPILEMTVAQLPSLLDDVQNIFNANSMSEEVGKR